MSAINSVVSRSALRSHKYAQCFVLTFEDGTIQFVSYRTPVIEITPDGYVHASQYFNCSRTTIKQVGWFLREYTAITYGYLKPCALSGYKVHGQYGNIEKEEL